MAEAGVQSGRSVDLGFTQGIVSIGDRLNPRLPNQESGIGQGANITVLTGLGSTSLDYTGFLATFADPASTNEFARPLVITDRDGRIEGSKLARRHDQRRHSKVIPIFQCFVRRSGDGRRW